MTRPERGNHWPDDVLVVRGGRYRVARATRADVPRVVALLRDDPLGRWREVGTDPAYDRAFHAIDANPDHLLLVVRNGADLVVATAHLTVLPGLSRSAATRLQVEAVRVAASERGTGLGTAMLGWAEEWGRGRGATLAQLTSDESRADALRFYRRLGYVASHVGLKRDLTT